MLQIDWATVGIVITIVSTVSGLTWWLSSQFASVKSMIFEKVSVVSREILNKIEYHERHDDSRFSELREDLAEIRIRNAAKDTMMATMLNKLEKMNGK